MFLSSLLGKHIQTDKKLLGVCVGVGVTPKTRRTIALIARQSDEKNALFPFSNLVLITDYSVKLTSARTLLGGKLCKLQTGLGAYSEKGEYLGNVEDAVLENGVLTKMLVGKKWCAANAVKAIGDVIILKKAPAFPLGLTAPEEFSGAVVTKTLLLKSIQKGELIRLTTALLPATK